MSYTYNSMNYAQARPVAAWTRAQSVQGGAGVGSDCGGEDASCVVTPSEEDVERRVRSGVQPIQAPAPGSFAERVCAAVKVALEEGVPNQRHVARALGVGERTLRRRLQGEQTHFRVLLDMGRRGLACEKLAGTDICLTQLAILLGFSHQSAFTRAFRRWYGVPPSAWRASARAHGTAHGHDSDGISGERFIG